MTSRENIDKLKDARDKIAEVYESEVQDDIHDNGNLTLMNNAIMFTEDSIQKLKSRLE